MKTLPLSSASFSPTLSVPVASISGFSGKSRHRKAVRTGTVDDEPIPFESLFSLLGNPVFLIAISHDDVPGKIMKTNEAASEVYGYTLPEFRTLTLSDLPKPDKDFLRIIAEGVESKGQADFLLEAGCDAVQGFYFCRPSPPEEIARLISAQNDTIRRSNARENHE